MPAKAHRASDYLKAPEDAAASREHGARLADSRFLQERNLTYGDTSGFRG